MSLYKVKATFVTTSLTYHPSALINTLKYEGLSKPTTGKNNTHTLDLNGGLSSTAKGSGFTTPQIVAITSAGNDSGASVTFKVEGTSDGTTSQDQTINAGNGSTVFTTKAFKTISKITVGGGNTTGNVSAGIASILEESSHSAGQAVTYTVKATNIPKEMAPLVLNLTSPGVTAVFDYGLGYQAVSREFFVDDDKISVESSGTVSGNLTLVGSATASFSNPHHVTVTGATNESSKWFLIKGATATSATDQEWVQGKSSAGEVVSTKAFKTVTSITVVDGNNSTTQATSAGKIKAGITDENKEYVVTIVAPQDSTNELNPHIKTISHSITQNGSVATAYNNEIADKSITVQDVNLPVASDSMIKTDKNTSYTFKTADFGYSDADGDAIAKIKITTLEAAGALKYNTSGSTWNDVTLNQVINTADIGKLKFTPATDAEGSGYGNFKFMVHDGLSYSASAATMKVNVGDSVQTTIKYFAQNTSGTAADQLIKSATIIMKDSGGNAVYAGAYTTNSSGVVDFAGVTDGAYSMSFTVTDSVKDSAINATDVSAVLDMSTKLNSSPTAKQKVSADTNGDGVINATDVSNILDMSTNLNQGVGTVALRDGSKSDPFTDKTISIVAGNNMNFDAYIIGDLDGSYANILMSA